MCKIDLHQYEIRLPVKESLRISVASDIHAPAQYKEIVGLIKDTAPDVIFIPGDLCHYADDCRIPVEFLHLAKDVAPVYYTFGNHERNTDESLYNINGVHLLNDKVERLGDIVIGGLRSGFRGQAENAVMETPAPDLRFLDDFDTMDGVKLLLCHHPEYYPRYLRDRNIDLIFAGHAHGGQWRLFGKGLFAPGQGLFPKYTSGIYEDRLIVSPGLANTVVVPRLFNPPALLTVDILPLN